MQTFQDDIMKNRLHIREIEKNYGEKIALLEKRIEQLEKVIFKLKNE